MLYDTDKAATVIKWWMKDRCIAFGETGPHRLYEDFSGWLVEQQGKAMRRLPGLTVFGQMLVAAGLTRTRKRGLTYYIGISLRPREPSA